MNEVKETEANSKTNSASDSFELAAQQRRPGLAREFLDFLLHNKKWWLTPIIVVLLLVGLLVLAGGSGAAPFIYTLF